MFRKLEISACLRRYQTPKTAQRVYWLSLPSAIHTHTGTAC